MKTTQVWAFLAASFIAILGTLVIAFKHAELAEKEAWVRCIRDIDQTSAQNLVCRSQYPGPYRRFLNELQGK